MKKFLLLVTLLIIILLLSFNIKKEEFNISIENVEKLNITPKALIILKNLSNSYNIDFAELFTIYALNNGFFETKNFNVESNTIEQNYILNYDGMKSLYLPKNINNYYEMFNALFKDIKAFPVPISYKNEYAYIDSYNSKFFSNNIEKGMLIFDRENVKGRLNVVVIADGIIKKIDTKKGYIKIKSYNDVYYEYSNVTNLSEGLKENDKVLVNDVLGFIGEQNFQTFFKISISIKTKLKNEIIYVNPYPLLRLIEDVLLKEKNG